MNISLESALRTTFLYEGNNITIFVNVPKKIRENLYFCSYFVSGLDNSFSDFSLGADSLQALCYLLSKLNSFLSKYNLEEHPDYGQTMPIAPFWLETEFLPNDINWEISCLEKKLDININVWDPKLSKVSEKIQLDSELVSREMIYRGGKARIIIGKPSLDKNENLYVCPLCFEGMPTPYFNKSYGETSFQAFRLTYTVLWYALLLIRDDIYSAISPNKSLGFPMIAEVEENEKDSWLNKRNNILKKMLEIKIP